jgi:hypothetical protein
MTSLVDRMIAAGRPDDEIAAVAENSALRNRITELELQLDRALPGISVSCPVPIQDDDGTAADCIAKGHCGCDEQEVIEARTEEKHPFFAFSSHGRDFYHCDIASRVDAVKKFTIEQCRTALELDGLQKSVRTAIERRIRKLEKSA